MGRANQGKHGRRAKPAPAPEVSAVTETAAAAGLTAERAQCILRQAPHWRYPRLRCDRACGGRQQTHVVVDHAWLDRAVLWCAGCGVADLWI